jgi:hypothetical protein
MRRSLLAVAAGVLTVLSSVTSGVGTALASQPESHPVAPGRSVTATLENNTPCTLQLTGGRLAEGHLTQDVPLVIQPYTAGTWKIAGWNAFGAPDADLAVVYAVTNCSLAGAQEGYAMQNSDAGGLYYTDGACAVNPEPGLRSTFTAVAAYHATLTIDLTVAGARRAGKPIVHPDLGACGGLPLS